MYELRISLAPSGDLRLHLPDARSRALDFPPNVSGLKLIQQILRNADAGIRDQPGHIAEFPTQAVLNAWIKQDKVAKEEARLERERIAHEDALASYAEQGIDVQKMEFKL